MIRAGKTSRWCALAAALTACVGCAVGPDYHRPATPMPAQLTRQPLASTVGSASGASQQWSSEAIAQTWWEVFGSDALNRRVQRALARNPDLDAATAALKQAQENVAAQRAAFFPSAQLNYSPSRQRDAVGTLSPTLASNATYYTLHTAQLNISYAPDVFGLNRRTVESLQAQADNQRYQLEAARLTLAANVVNAAIQEASLRSQMEATQAIIDAQTKALAILHDQARLGYASGLDVAAQESALAQARQSLPPLEKQLEQNRDLLAVLCGDTPDQAGTPEFDLEQLTLPITLPQAVSSQLITQRPDVRAAEENVHDASAQVGVALANRLPQFTLSGAYGGSSTSFTRMFTDDNVFWSLAGSVSQTVFDFGALKHKQRAAEAALQQSAAQYRSVVLGAFQNVADTLYAIDSDARALAAADDAETAAERTLTLTQKQQQLGYVNALALINAQQAYQQARISRVQAQAARLSDTAALMQALGGGWRGPAMPN
ncbi:efflux transporter, outer membrane factor (OMF) lipoprotein, NodT family [Dyella jiangningensis]|uniref:efflux transporter outer membrane subunit n=1 Tax=Dyella sp. AtDHG13 TaxID=1938897 RepID=UPI00087F5C95|nr:efflux transporter outer membrane subunit [Dyella sp. AtDHG13]PXV61599.1 NodT family efflux transporter outer membrane factor (OMF) lipoprotein [Dyella sp. AtDHG13]SDJ70101.1 efflux transporter, outer membrane factor (OMF) lipoprotein, NodT family [Dyella jiangningensis]